MRREQSLKITALEIQRAFAETKWAEAYPPILTVDQAAALLAVPKATIYQWRSQGLLGDCARRVGKHLRFVRDRLITKIFNEGLYGQEV